MKINDNRDEETRLRLLNVLDSEETEWTQRGLADQLGISLGKTNYCVRELSRAGFIRIRRFRRSNNKLACAYALTSSGIEEHFRLLVHFLSRKLREYELLRKEIAEINQELVKHGSKRLEARELSEIR
jgi:EPS-associated MarR family transcriptional regulator